MMLKLVYSIFILIVIPTPNPSYEHRKQSILAQEGNSYFLQYIFDHLPKPFYDSCTMLFIRIGTFYLN